MFSEKTTTWATNKANLEGKHLHLLLTWSLCTETEIIQSFEQRLQLRLDANGRIYLQWYDRLWGKGISSMTYFVGPLLGWDNHF